MLRELKKFRQLLNRHQKGRIVVLLILMIVGAFFETFSVSLMLPLVSAIMQPDIIETNPAVAWVCGLLDLHSHRTFALVCIIALIGMFIFKDVFLALEYYVQARFVNNNRFATQCRLFDAYLHRNYEYFLSAHSGEILRVIQNDVNEVFNTLSVFLVMATELVVSGALVITVFVISPLMTAFVAAMMLFMMVLITKVLKPILHRAGVAVQQGNASVNKWLIQAINGIKEVKVAQREGFFLSHFEKNGKELVHATKINAVAQRIPQLLIEMASVCSALAVIAILIYRGQPMETLIPALSVFAMAAVKLLPGANRIVSAMNAVTYSEPALDKLLENLNALENFVESRDESDSEGRLLLEHEIAMKDISYCYPGSDKRVLEKADMAIPVGKSVGIVGTSGAGKTTAVDLLLGLLAPCEGQVTADGVDVRSAYRAWLSHIGYIPQMIFMLDGSIRENVAFGYNGTDKEDVRLWKALEEAQLADFVRTLPDGVDTQIGERGVRLSGGQRQRIGIARALFMNPDVLVFDEATSALDNETEEMIMGSINALHGRKTMIIIAHRLTTIEGCDMVYRVENGKVAKVE